MFAGEERFASPAELASALFPLLDQCASTWRARCSLESRAPSAFRSTLAVEAPGSRRRASRSARRRGSGTPGAETSLLPGTARARDTPGSAVFQPDGKVLARFGDRLLYFVGDRPLKVAVPPEHRDTVAASRCLVRGPGGGFALVGPGHVLLIRGSRFAPRAVAGARHRRRGGRDPGGDRRRWRVRRGDGGDRRRRRRARAVDVGTATPGHPRSSSRWEATCRRSPHGPYGFLVVGSRGRSRGRALFLPFGGHASVYVAGVNDGPPLQVAQCGAERVAWSAGAGFVLAFLRGAVEREAVEVDEAPVAMGLDPVGVPWLVTHRAVLRRQIEAGTP